MKQESTEATGAGSILAPARFELCGMVRSGARECLSCEQAMLPGV